MTNPEKILAALDVRLTAKVELTLYGRAALALGFGDSPPTTRPIVPTRSSSHDAAD